MRKRTIIRTLTSLFLLVTLLCLTQVTLFASTTYLVKDAHQFVYSWNLASSVLTSKNNGPFDSSDITQNGYFYITYTSNENSADLIMQSWSGGANWANVTPSERGTTSDGTYYAKFDYDSLVAAYGTNFSTLDMIHVRATTASITLIDWSYIDASYQSSSGSTSSSNTSSTKLITQTYPATSNYVKPLGRTHYYNNTLWLAPVGSGIEFTCKGTNVAITVVGDEVATASWGDLNRARIAIYVNDELVIDDRVTQAQKTYTVLNSNTAQTANIRVVKLTEATYSTVGIKSITATTTKAIEPIKASSRKIEFIGDSITCGFGVDDENPNGTFNLANEDASKSYGYKTAQALDADYSMIAYSGYGVLSGYSSDGNIVESQTIPKLYNQLGFSYGHLDSSLDISSLSWDFSKFEPDLIVINLGTNDASYCGTDTQKQAAFTSAYVSFLKQIRSHNPNAQILCTLGIVNDTLYSAIEQAATNYTSQTGDTHIACMKFNTQLASDGYAAAYHPTEKTHAKAAKQLTSKIEDLMNW